ncbi:MAG: hypothetical protein HKN71_01760 [Gemmatimonadetes bacterium]|nr:hypothetical protein [Gemmatimonadota bacterium]
MYHTRRPPPSRERRFEASHAHRMTENRRADAADGRTGRLRARGGGWLLAASDPPPVAEGRSLFALPTPPDPRSTMDASRWLRLRAEASHWPLAAPSGEAR